MLKQTLKNYEKVMTKWSGNGLEDKCKYKEISEIMQIQTMYAIAFPKKLHSIEFCNM